MRAEDQMARLMEAVTVAADEGGGQFSLTVFGTIGTVLACLRSLARPDPKPGKLLPNCPRIPKNSKGLPEGEVDEARLLVAEPHVDGGEERLRDRDPEPASVAVLEVRHEAADLGRRQAELVPELRLGAEDAPGFAEGRAADAHVPDVEEVERVDREPVLEVREHAGRTEEASREESPQRVVAAEPLD